MSSRAEPTSKKRKLDDYPSPHRATVSLENTVTQDNARAHFGDSHTQNINGPVYITSDPVPTAAEDQSRNVETLIESLAFEQMDACLETIQKAHPKTCQWLFARDEYKAWRDPTSLRAHHGFFWIKGKPGAGKSTLMTCAKEFGEKKHSDVVISFFFKARGEELERSKEGMYRSLLCQLLDKKPELSSAMMKRKKRAVQRGWSVETLRNMFEATICALGDTKVTCYVDALDECDYEQAKDIVESFESFGRSAVEASMEFRVLFSSRHYPHTTTEGCIEMTLEGQEGHEADIADYVRCKLNIGKSKLAMEIRESIQVRASGVFLWVVLVIRMLNDCNLRGKTHLLRKRLEAVPDGLSELFKEILQRGTHDVEDTLLTYQLILFASRPLKREELYFAIATSSDDVDVHDFSRDEITADVMNKFLLDSSKGLAEVTKGKYPTIQFIHESVREYLLRTGLRFLRPCLDGTLVEQSHNDLWRCCHQYLKKSGAALLLTATDGVRKYMPRDRKSIHSLQARISDSRPFLGYAIDGVLYHANLAHSVTYTQDELVAAFPHELWRRLYNLRCNYKIRRLSDASPSLYTFILAKAYNLAAIEIQNKPWQVNDFATGEYHPSLLGAALANDDLQTMQLLLKGGVSPHGLVTCTSKSDCLAFAIDKKDVSMVRALVDSGADLCRKTFGECYLRLALWPECYDHRVIQILLTHEPYSIPTFWPPRLTEAFMGAQKMNDILTQQILVEKLVMATNELESSGNTLTGEHFTSAFVAACLHGSESLMRRFLNHGSLKVEDILPLGMEAAIQQGHLNAVRMLLDNGFEVDSSWHPCMSRRYRRGEFSLKAEFSRFGFQVSSKVTAFNTALREKQDDIVKLLLDRGAEVDPRSAIKLEGTLLLTTDGDDWVYIIKHDT